MEARRKEEMRAELKELLRKQQEVLESRMLGALSDLQLLEYEGSDKKSLTSCVRRYLIPRQPDRDFEASLRDSSAKVSASRPLTCDKLCAQIEWHNREMNRTGLPQPHEQRKIEQLLIVLAKKQPISPKPAPIAYGLSAIGTAHPRIFFST